MPSKLPQAVQSLARLMFNQSIIDRTLAELKYDATKQPLGRIGGSTLKRALGVLSAISDLLETPSGSRQANLQALSNQYLSLIPHVFPRNTRPPIVNNMEMVRNELDVLATLGEMEAGAKLMKSTAAGDVNPLDARIDGLNLNKLEALNHASKEFRILEEYAVGTQGPTHQHMKYRVEDIFVVERSDDCANPLGKIGSKKLLWHGSRCSNWPGILVSRVIRPGVAVLARRSQSLVFYQRVKGYALRRQRHRSLATCLERAYIWPIPCRRGMLDQLSTR